MRLRSPELHLSFFDEEADPPTSQLISADPSLAPFISASDHTPYKVQYGGSRPLRAGGGQVYWIINIYLASAEYPLLLSESGDIHEPHYIPQVFESQRVLRC